MAAEMSRQLSTADTILLGRKTYQAMASYWPWQAANPGYPRQDIAFADMINRCRKVVFSDTLQTLNWNNSQLATNMNVRVPLLKSGDGKNILVYGSCSVVAGLESLNLVDEFQLWIHPVVLVNGLPFPGNRSYLQSLKLAHSMEFDSGVMLCRYYPQPRTLQHS